ncbi:gluconokinase [Nocardia sp. NBC_00511]|uniref:gluconokinase n=1 Tax=Nocardia sp. NBC_00511 TaxID=2903591 RepID=UPI0030E0DB88
MTSTPATRPHIVIVMGVSGSGKSTVAAMLATRLGWDLIEGDDLHPPANVAKMASGHALTDADREPWLREIAERISTEVSAGRSALITCSALKRSYRDLLRQGVIRHPEAVLIFLYLHGSRAELERRLTARIGHFMPAGLLDSQLATLEEPAGEADAVTVKIGPPPDAVAATALAAIRQR